MRFITCTHNDYGSADDYETHDDLGIAMEYAKKEAADCGEIIGVYKLIAQTETKVTVNTNIEEVS